MTISLTTIDGKTGLINSSDEKAKPVVVDFQNRGLLRRIQTGSVRQGLAKAVGLDKKKGVKVVDATAGLGIDAFYLAAMGCEVTMLEKSSVVFRLLEDGIRRGLACEDSGIVEALHRTMLIQQDSMNYFAGITAGVVDQPDTIYLDPMFPQRQKSARVKKGMSALQELLGPDDNIELMLAQARKVAGRVVLKKPGKISKNPDPAPSFQVPGKTCHFQVFIDPEKV